MTELTKPQMAKLLAVCARYDGRVLDEQTFDAWHDLLADICYEDVHDAIVAHYRTDRRWIMPADIVAYHEQRVAARLRAMAIPEPPRELAGNPPAYRAALRAAALAIAERRDPEAAMQAVAAQARAELEA
jgi:hypothetical protein